MKTTLAVIVLSSIFGVSAAAQTPPAPKAPVDPVLEAARVKYASDQWPSGPRRGGFELESITLPGFTGEENDYRDHDVARAFTDAKGVHRLLIEAFVGETAADAHAALLQHVAHVQSDKTLPTASSRGIRAGDLGYIGYGGKDGSKIAWLAFVAGNLEFRVVNLACDADGAPDVKSVVELITARVAQLPPLADGVPLPRPKIDSFTADRTTCVAGETLLLNVVASDPSGKAARLDFELGGTAQGYVEPDDAGRWTLHATKAGKLAVTLRVLGANGLVATKSLDVDVTAN